MEEMLKIIANKYNRKELLIRTMFQIGINNNISIKETQELIEDFFTQYS